MVRAAMDRSTALGMPLVGSECIAEGAMVETPCGMRAIELLLEGDTLVSMDPSTGERFETKAVRVHATRRECVALRFGRTTLRCTPRQPIYDPSEGVFAPASEWIEGRRQALLDVDLRRVLVDTVLLDGGCLRVFDVSVAHPLHNFIVDGVLVHNETLAVSAAQVR